MADRQYELVYIPPPDTTEQQVTELHQQIEAVVLRMNGQIEKTEPWGRRKLAYEIGHHKEGVYVLEVINGTGELMKELDRRLRVMDLVLRHLVVRVDEEKKVVDRTRTKRQTESERRRVKRGLPPQRQPGEGQRRRRTRPRRQEAGRQGKGPAPADVPPQKGVQVLRGQDRRHQLQGR